MNMVISISILATTAAARKNADVNIMVVAVVAENLSLELNLFITKAVTRAGITEKR